MTVSVHDGKDASGNSDTSTDDTIEVTVTVTNVDEEGAVGLLPVQPQVDSWLRASITDPDRGIYITTGCGRGPRTKAAGRVSTGLAGPVTSR